MGPKKENLKVDFTPLWSPISLKQVSQRENICEQRNQIQEEPVKKIRKSMYLTNIQTVNKDYFYFRVFLKTRQYKRDFLKAG